MCAGMGSGWAHFRPYSVRIGIQPPQKDHQLGPFTNSDPVEVVQAGCPRTAENTPARLHSLTSILVPPHEPIDPAHGDAKLLRQISSALTREVALHDFQVATLLFGDQTACWFLGKGFVRVECRQNPLHDAEQGVT